MELVKSNCRHCFQRKKLLLEFKGLLRLPLCLISSEDGFFSYPIDLRRYFFRWMKKHELTFITVWRSPRGRNCSELIEYEIIKKKLKVLEKWAWSLNEGFDDNERNEQQPEVDEVTRWRLIARVFLAHFAMLDLDVAVALRSLRLDRLAYIGFAAVKLTATKRD